MPTKVESFITDAALERLDGTGSWSVVKPNAAPGDPPGPGSGTRRLNEDACTPRAPLGGLACYAGAASTGGGGPAVYGRVVREDGQVVLQYWYFYYDDVHSYAYPPSDFLWQAHEGDWENVDVVLAGDGEPEFVGYAMCVPNQVLAVLRGLGLALPVDYAFAGPIARPPGAGGDVMPIHQLGDDAAWLQFPGSWGELQYFRAPLPIGTVAFGTSPVGPAYHAEWNDPLGTLATWQPGQDTQ
jgi:hypothetical protein